MTGTLDAAAQGRSADPHRVTLTTLSWLHAHRRWFRLPVGVTAPGVDHNVTLKPLGELAQLSVSIARVAAPGGRTHRLARDLLEFAWRETRQGELLAELAQAEPHATHPLELYAPFAEAGLRNRRFENFARLMVRTRSWAVTEQEPTRVLAVLRAEQRLGLRPPAETDRDTAAATRRTWLGGLPEPWAFEGRSGYALTHHVFHVTAWGSLPSGLPDALADYLTHWLPAWLDSCLEEERWDLAGELLAVCSCLPAPLPADGEWLRYAAAQAPSGAFAETGAVPDGETREAFLACYHPTLVAAFASALTAARTPTPDGALP